MSLIIFIVLMAAWLFHYFLYDELIVSNLLINDHVVLTHVNFNILGALLMVVVFVVLHVVFKKTNDLILDDQETSRLMSNVVTTSYGTYFSS